MKSQFAWVLRVLAALIASAQPLFAGTVNGTVSLVENGHSRSDASNVVVWIEGTRRPAKASEALAGKAADPVPSMKSIHKKFAPRVIVVEAGNSVSFPNDDRVYHNVFSVSGENQFDLGLYRRGRSKDKKFETPGLVRVYCNIHPQMVGFIRVVDSSFSAVTGSDGSFVFEGVPDGPHTVKAWCDEGGETAANVMVSPRKTAAVSLTLDVGGFKPQAHKNKYGQDYPPPPEDEDRY